MIEEWIEKPSLLVPPQKDFVNKPLLSDLTTAAILAFPVDKESVKSHFPHLLEAIKKIYKDQLKDYLEGGSKSNPTEEQLDAASCVPIHNMASERILGLLDFLRRRAPNASQGFLNGKIRYRLNSTMPWLESLPKEEQEKIISFARSEAGNARQASKTLMRRIQEKIQQRRQDVERQRDKQLRGRTKDYIRKRMRDNYNVEDCLPTEIDDKPFDISEEVRGLVVNLMNNAAFLNGCLFQHTWEEDGEDVTYYARVVKPFKKNKLQHLKIAYWRMTELEEEHVVWELSLFDLVVDFLFGDAVFWF